MLPITTHRDKTVTYRGEQRMLDGIEHMKRGGWRVVTSTQTLPHMASSRSILLGRLSIALAGSQPRFTVTYIWP